MANKKSKPVRIEWTRQYKSKQNNDVHVFDIEFEDRTFGVFTTTKKNQTKFKIGEEVEYTSTETTDGRGTVYNKIDKVSSVSGGYDGKKGGYGKSPEAQKSILASVCLDCAVILVEQSPTREQVTTDLKGLFTLSNKFYDYIVAKSGNDEQKRINYQSRL